MRRIIVVLVMSFLILAPAFAQGYDTRIRRSTDFSIMDSAQDFAGMPVQQSVPGSAMPIQQMEMPRGASPAFVKQLAPREVSVLSSRDIIVLVDRSGSMQEKDCPPQRYGLQFLTRWGQPLEPISRWDWCENEMMRFSNLTSGFLRQGMKVVMFASDQTSYSNVRLHQIAQIFHRNYPSGSTNAAPALKAQLDWYFQNRVNARQNTRPVAIAIITDGLPNNTRALKKAIVDATRSMQRPDEIAITFLQVGNDRNGIKLAHELDDDLVRQGAMFDIVDSKDFSELLQIGLARALVDSITESNRVAGRPY